MTLLHRYASQRPELVIHHMPSAASPPPLAIQPAAPTPTVNPQLPHSQGPPAPPPPPGGWAGIIPSGTHSVRTAPPQRLGPTDGWKKRPDKERAGAVIPAPAPVAPTPEPTPVPTIGKPQEFSLATPALPQSRGRRSKTPEARKRPTSEGPMPRSKSRAALTDEVEEVPVTTKARGRSAKTRKTPK